jgi:hypothetical protein
MPADSFQDGVTVKWVGDENPWKPNMTIAEPIVEVVTVVQTQVVIEKRDPTPDEIKSAQGEILKESASVYGSYLVIVVVVATISYFVVRFVYRARKRKMWEKR